MVHHEIILLTGLLMSYRELKFINKTPFKVIIDEYVNIASSFYDKKSVDFVNAILNKSHE